MRRTAQAIYDKKKKGEKITALTAYDYPFAKILDQEGIDMILIGDSLGMVLLGYESTLPVTMEDMLHHAKPVARAVENSLVIADMPYGTCDDATKAVSNATRFVEEAGVDGVKVEGGREVRRQVEALVAAGIPVLGHIGMTPQSADRLGGFRVQGREEARAQAILEDARLLDRLGCFAMVLECIPDSLAEKITREVGCPTIGIGAGAKTDGQILVLHDMLGFHGKVRPKFVRRYATFEDETRRAVRAYCDDVKHGKFPSKQETYTS